VNEAEPERITINVQTLSGQLPPIFISTEATVRDLKLRVQAMNAAFAFDRQKLLIHRPDDAGSGVVLLNRRTLQSYQITESTNVVLIMLPSPGVEVCIDSALTSPDSFQALLDSGDLHAAAVEVSSVSSHRAKLLQLFDENHAIQSIKISGPWTEEHLTFCQALVTLRPDVDIKFVVNDNTCSNMMLRVVDFCQSNQCSSIQLSIFSLENSDYLALVSALQSMPSLLSLTITDGSISDVGCVELATALQSMSSLKILELSSNNISALGCVALAPVLQSMSCLHTLDLFLNLIGDEGCVALASALQSMSSLQTLGLNINEIGNEGCAALAPALQSMTALQTLDLSNNQIGDEGCQALVPALLSMSSLRTLDLSEHQISDEVCVAFASALRSVSSLQIFGLTSSDAVALEVDR
jgi:Ran GTPase-activating protein (RanGAP) involved in mRNA processing and transport